MDEFEDVKIALPIFLKILTSNGVPVSKSMAITAKIYKEYNTPAHLRQLNDFKLKASGIDDNEDRKLIITALRTAGYISRKQVSSSVPSTSSLASNEAAVVNPQNSPTKKRKRKPIESEKNEFLPDRPLDESSESLQFNEVLDESTLQSKSTVVNRAPLMAAWATIVAERMGFQRDEALSIASSYTEMNAISKGVSLGMYKDGKQNGLEAVTGGTQPYVNLMGRRPLYQMHNERWRALHSGTPTQPNTAFSYISRSLRQTMPFIVGALQLLASSFTSQEINEKAWGLYTQFRPAGDGWGERSQVRCATILALRKRPGEELVSESTTAPADIVNYESIGEKEPDDRETKRVKSGMTFEEYEAALDEDHTFDHLDLDI
ncbi:hypothetical protein BDP27DRAFT_1209460 [Rhodocollybia butyracea]|uniref:Uncharacterized protein n=1 Tax=Rhodocollybia butyracea TaxID=206335 RepID=A0A9P5Q7Q0_9AGAR|nr:hypothetical protein BDP27DRAFT_1209460 [Rhodocollybia butyracea]